MIKSGPIEAVFLGKCNLCKLLKSHILDGHMSKIAIQNRAQLIESTNREDALSIIEVGLNAIDTEEVINSAISIDNKTLNIKDLKFDLEKYKRVRVVGFGKASCEAAVSLEKVLGKVIDSGAVIDIKYKQCEIIESLVGTHPRSSLQNVTATQQLLEIVKDLNENDLVIVIVSGGGSALLCATDEEWKQSEKVYDDFIQVGANIEELNTVRKHLSSLKGGGLAKILFPATVVGLIFCDIPGGDYEKTASGPTCKDTSTIHDAETILRKYNFTGFELNETPKEDKYFEKVHNILMVSNSVAANAMSAKAKELGYDAKILSVNIYTDSKDTIAHFKELAGPKTVVIGAGEVSLIVKGGGGSGGRCAYMGMIALPLVGDDETLVAVASDGLDNSPSAGVIVDKSTVARVAESGVNVDEYLNHYDAYNFFEKVGDASIVTGQTGANVSDLMLWIKK
jgi:glycerate-2-kinase